MATGTAPGFKILFPDDLKEYMEQHDEGTYLLLDVRQPEEYEQSRLPGSKPVPLPLLPASLGELDRAKDTIVYCEVGGRSLMAAQFLAARGFDRVFQLQGGLDAWEDRTATGPAGLHLEFVRGNETAQEAAQTAYAMESGLEQFHRLALEKAANPEVKDLLAELIKAEESHKRKLEALLRNLGSAPEASPPGVEGRPARMEGGLDIDDFLSENEKYLQSLRGCLELAMMIETQALDLYLRMAETCADRGAREVFFLIGDEEKAHLGALGRVLGKVIGDMGNEDVR